MLSDTLDNIKEKYDVGNLEEALDRIIDLAYDYDGFSKAEDLKDLIDELADLAELARIFFYDNYARTEEL